MRKERKWTISSNQTDVGRLGVRIERPLPGWTYGDHMEYQTVPKEHLSRYGIAQRVADTPTKRED